MSNRTPRYRSFKKDYGGDPDSTILRDLHRRLMKLEIAFDRAHKGLVALDEDVASVHLKLRQLLVMAGGTVDSAESAENSRKQR